MVFLPALNIEVYTWNTAKEDGGLFLHHSMPSMKYEIMRYKAPVLRDQICTLCHYLCEPKQK